jgi:uncharacterized protein (TIGR02646 family)
MRTVIKGNEPSSLVQHRCTPFASYDNYPDKDTLRGSLVAEQRGLCCYCLSRIRAERDQMKIEHWHCQDRYPAEQLDYRNLLGACLGNEGQSRRHQHCDTRKGNDDLSRNPANPMHRVEDLMRFQADGRVASDDPTFDAELNDVLNLNEAFLRRNRKDVLDGFTGALGRYGEIPATKLNEWLRDWNGESHRGELRPFCQVVVYWLRKRLARA